MAEVSSFKHLRQRETGWHSKSGIRRQKTLRSAPVSTDSLATLLGFTRLFDSKKPQPPQIHPASHKHRFVSFSDNVNKVFASVWLDSERILTGSKCNALKVVDSNRVRQIADIAPICGYWGDNGKWVHGAVDPTFPIIAVESTDSIPTPQRSPPMFQGVFNWSPMLTADVLQDHPLYPRPMAATAMMTAQYQQPARNAPQPPQIPECRGIHSVAVNPSRSLLAVAAGSPIESIQIYTLPHLDAFAICRSHTDMVFSVEFCSDSSLVSGGRDGQVCFWNLDDETTIKQFLPRMDGGCVRLYEPVTGSFPPPKKKQISLTSSLSLNPSGFLGKIFQGFTASSSSLSPSLPSSPQTPNGSKIAALSSSTGTVKLFDINHQNSSSNQNGLASPLSQSPVCEHSGNNYGINPSTSTDVRLIHTQETVCMATPTPATNSVNHPISNCIAIGSMSHVSIVDPRQAVVASTVKSVDDEWGVRSLAFDSRGGLTVGGGIGRVSFLDLRVLRYVEWRDLEDIECGGGGGVMRKYLTVEDERRVDGEEWNMGVVAGGGNGRGLMRDAVYTLSYCPYGVRLFAAGGPLQLNMSGSYAGIWG
ncbi:WD40-repeat-containing domain protein [Obelidium mucronatum]|nr:WD40-repeat-containing domain protein [Obelidium mucronatum]